MGGKEGREGEGKIVRRGGLEVVSLVEGDFSVVVCIFFFVYEILRGDCF